VVEVLWVSVHAENGLVDAHHAHPTALDHRSIVTDPRHYA
jgi:hypothetical protein